MGTYINFEKTERIYVIRLWVRNVLSIEYLCSNMISTLQVLLHLNFGLYPTPTPRVMGVIVKLQYLATLPYQQMSVF